MAAIQIQAETVIISTGELSQSISRSSYPIVGDSDVAVLDGYAYRAGHADACHVKIAKERAGGFPVTAVVGESTATVYVVNDTDGKVSLFPSLH